MAKNVSVMGIYPDRATVADAVSVLNRSGYRATDVSVLSSKNSGSKDFGHEPHTKASHGAAIGSVAGAVAGAALAWLISTQPVTIAALGPLTAAGPVVASLAGAGVGGTLGWIVDC
jgi:hypothetical protein